MFIPPPSLLTASKIASQFAQFKSQPPLSQITLEELSSSFLEECLRDDCKWVNKICEAQQLLEFDLWSESVQSIYGKNERSFLSLIPPPLPLLMTSKIASQFAQFQTNLPSPKITLEESQMG